eukprot:2371009-Karenia_brevis.AAC.1
MPPVFRVRQPVAQEFRGEGVHEGGARQRGEAHVSPAEARLQAAIERFDALDLRWVRELLDAGLQARNRRRSGGEGLKYHEEAFFRAPVKDHGRHLRPAGGHDHRLRQIAERIGLALPALYPRHQAFAAIPAEYPQFAFWSRVGHNVASHWFEDPGIRSKSDSFFVIGERA